MRRLDPTLKTAAWGSPTRLPEFAGWQTSEEPIAEAWFGAHAAATSCHLVGTEWVLRDYIAADPALVLGRDVVERLGPDLPFLLKLIAPASALSLQVHPTAEQAALGYVKEERAGVPVDSRSRTYRDPNHKPEMIYALERFEAVSGFRAPRRALEVLSGLDVPLLHKCVERIRSGSSSQGMRSAFEYVLLGARDRDSEVYDVVEQIALRLESGRSPAVRSDTIALRLAAEHPGDRGILASLLLNPVTLQPGEVMFVPAGCVHAYLSGLGVEVMANSDNVIRAGLTQKHIDARALVDTVDVRPAPPMRVAAERMSSSTEVFYAPVEEFELAVIQSTETTSPMRGFGPRIALAVAGQVTVSAGDTSEDLRPGAAVFLEHGEAAEVTGNGTLVQASVP